MRIASLHWLPLLLGTALGGCAARTPTDARTAAVTDRVRAAYGPLVRTVTRVAPTSTAMIPLCPRDGEGLGDTGYVLVIEEREVGDVDAIVIARALCRRSRPVRGSGSVAHVLERFTLQRRGAAWHVTARELLEDRSR